MLFFCSSTIPTLLPALASCYRTRWTRRPNKNQPVHSLVLSCTGVQIWKCRVHIYEAIKIDLFDNVVRLVPGSTEGGGPQKITHFVPVQTIMMSRSIFPSQTNQPGVDTMIGGRQQGQQTGRVISQNADNFRPPSSSWSASSSCCGSLLRWSRYFCNPTVIFRTVILPASVPVQ